MKIIPVSNIPNKFIYNKLVQKKIEKPTSVKNWDRSIVDHERSDLQSTYCFIFQYLEENKLKIFRWKLLHFLIPKKQLLCKWKLTNNSLCNFCNIEEDYFHYLMTCPYLKTFWDSIHHIFKKYGMEIKIKLKHIVFGYKISDSQYYDFNYFFTIVGYTIYKTYYVSEQKTKLSNVYTIFKREFLERMNV